MKQLIKFGIVGISNTMVSFLLYTTFSHLFQRIGIFGSNDYLVASVIAFFLSVLWSFYWNSIFTFKRREGEKRKRWKALLKTYVSYSVAGLFLNNILLYVFVETVGILKSIAYLVSVVITVPVNFLLNKYWAFKSEK